MKMTSEFTFHFAGECWSCAICWWRTRWARLWGWGTRQSRVAWEACMCVTEYLSVKIQTNACKHEWELYIIWIKINKFMSCILNSTRIKSNDISLSSSYKTSSVVKMLTPSSTFRHSLSTLNSKILSSHNHPNLRSSSLQRSSYCVVRPLLFRF